MMPEIHFEISQESELIDDDENDDDDDDDEIDDDALIDVCFEKRKRNTICRCPMSNKLLKIVEFDPSLSVHLGSCTLRTNFNI